MLAQPTNPAGLFPRTAPHARIFRQGIASRRLPACVVFYGSRAHGPRHERHPGHPGPRMPEAGRRDTTAPVVKAAPVRPLPKSRPSVVTALGVSVAEADRWRVLGGHGRNGAG